MELSWLCGLGAQDFRDNQALLRTVDRDGTVLRPFCVHALAERGVGTGGDDGVLRGREQREGVLLR